MSTRRKSQGEFLELNGAGEDPAEVWSHRSEVSAPQARRELLRPGESSSDPESSDTERAPQTQRAHQTQRELLRHRESSSDTERAPQAQRELLRHRESSSDPERASQTQRELFTAPQTWRELLRHRERHDPKSTEGGHGLTLSPMSPSLMKPIHKTTIETDPR